MKKPQDTDDKDKWLMYGEEKEQEFVNYIASISDLDVKINPEKEDNKTAIDLIVDGKLTDLKCQREPFFLAEKKYGVSPNSCVTFNSNDFLRYSEYDEDIDIIFWVEWDKQKRFGVRVDKKSGIWRIEFNKLKKKIDNSDYSKHKYKTRKEDFKNCRSSFVLNLDDMSRIH